jgi:hypothetical protein
MGSSNTTLRVTYLKEYKSNYNKDTCKPMLIAELFTIIKLWKQPRCSTMHEWIEKMWSIQPLPLLFLTLSSLSAFFHSF